MQAEALYASSTTSSPLRDILIIKSEPLVSIRTKSAFGQRSLAISPISCGLKLGFGRIVALPSSLPARFGLSPRSSKSHPLLSYLLLLICFPAC